MRSPAVVPPAASCSLPPPLAPFPACYKRRLTPDTNPRPPADPASCSPAPASPSASPAPSDTSAQHGNTKSRGRADSAPSLFPVHRRPPRIASAANRRGLARDAPPHCLLDLPSTAANRAAPDRDALERAPLRRQLPLSLPHP